MLVHSVILFTFVAVCPEPPNVVAIIGGSIAAVAIIGILLLMLIKLLIHMKDIKEFKKFQNEQKKSKWAEVSTFMLGYQWFLKEQSGKPENILVQKVYPVSVSKYFQLNNYYNIKMNIKYQKISTV